MGKLNITDLANTVSKKEGKKIQTGVGNVREVIRLTMSELANEDLYDVVELLQSYKNTSILTKLRKKL